MKRLLSIFLLVCFFMMITLPSAFAAFGTTVTVISGVNVGKSTNLGGGYSNYWQYWSQGASSNSSFRSNGCWMVAQAKMLVEMGIASSNVSVFNPDVFYNAAGYYREYATTYAKDKGYEVKCQNIALTGDKAQDKTTIMSYLNLGYYCILYSSGHKAYIGRNISLSRGEPVVLNSSGVYQYNQELCHTFVGYTDTFTKMVVFEIVGKKLTITGEHGSVSGTAAIGTKTIKQGTQVTLEATPIENYYFSKWTISGVSGLTTSTSNPLTFTMPNNNVTVSVIFNRNANASVWEWKNIKIDSVTQTDASLSATFSYGASLLENYSDPYFYVLYGSSQSEVANASMDSLSNMHVLSLGQVSGSTSLFDHTYNLKINSMKTTAFSLPLIGIVSPAYQLSPNETFYYKWIAITTNNNNRKVMESSVRSGTTKGASSTWSNLHTNDSQYGLFNGQVNWDKSVTMNEVGCFVSTNLLKIIGATRDNANGTEVKKDVGNINQISSLATSTTYGTIVFYRGPSFGSITSFTSGTSYYYKFYSYTSDGQVAYSPVAQYIPGGNSGSQQLTSVWMTPNSNQSITEGTSIAFSYGADQTADFYFHIYDRNTKIDTSTKVKTSATSGSYTYTFNTVGSYKIYFGAAHPLGDKASNSIIVTVNPTDSTIPIITAASIGNITSTGYDVYVEATDDTALKMIRIGTWHDGIAIGEAVKQEVTSLPDGKATFHVSISDFDNARGVCYHTNAFAHDTSGNHSIGVRCGDVVIENNPPVITSASIINVTSDGYDVVYSIVDDTSTSSVILGITNDIGTEESITLSLTCSDDTDFPAAAANGSIHVNINDGSLAGAVNTTYHTTITAKDHCGNISAAYTLDDVFVGVRDLYEERDVSKTMMLPGMLFEIDDETFNGVSAQYFVLPFGITTIGSRAFPPNSTIFLYGSSILSVDNALFGGSGTIVEMDEDYNRQLASQFDGTSVQYIRRNGTQISPWGSWSDWSTTAVTPSNTVQVEAKTFYRYRDTTYTTEYTAWSNWGAYDTVRKTISDANLMQEQSARVYVWYWYACPNCGAHSPRYGNTCPAGCGGTVSSEYRVAWLDISSTASGTYSKTIAGTTRTAYNSSYGEVYYNTTDNANTTYTGYRYRTRTAYQQAHVGEWSIYSMFAPETAENREIESTILYRYRTKVQ